MWCKGYYGVNQSDSVHTGCLWLSWITPFLGNFQSCKTVASKTLNFFPRGDIIFFFLVRKSSALFPGDQSYLYMASLFAIQTSLKIQCRTKAIAEYVKMSCKMALQIHKTLYYLFKSYCKTPWWTCIRDGKKPQS